jgi:hypothetical protein
MLIVGELHRIDTPRSTTIDDVRDRTMAKREQERARPGDKSWQGGRVPGFCCRGGARETKAAAFTLGNTFIINALRQKHHDGFALHVFHAS